jgi:hypothetical protein
MCLSLAIPTLSPPPTSLKEMLIKIGAKLVSHGR